MALRDWCQRLPHFFLLIYYLLLNEDNFRDARLEISSYGYSKKIDQIKTMMIIK